MNFESHKIVIVDHYRLSSLRNWKENNSLEKYCPVRFLCLVSGQNRSTGYYWNLARLICLSKVYALDIAPLGYYLFQSIQHALIKNSEYQRNKKLI